jgi:hypothetical protein
MKLFLAYLIIKLHNLTGGKLGWFFFKGGAELAGFEFRGNGVCYGFQAGKLVAR